MNVLFELVSALDNYTLGHVQRRLKGENSSSQALLFHYKNHKGSEPPHDTAVARLLYGAKANTNTLYRLKNKLVYHIGQALIDIHCAEGEQRFITEQYMMLFNIFKDRTHYKLAGYYLEKAEKSAREKEQYALLDIIYGEFIIFSKDFLPIDPELYIKRRRENEKMQRNFKIIDEILALITYRLKITQNMSSRFDVSHEIEHALGSFTGDDEVFRSVQFKIKFYKTISQILVQQKKYADLEKYLETTYVDFERTRVFNRHTHDIKVEQLVYWSNALMMQQKFDATLDKSNLLEKALREYDSVLYEKYVYFLYQLQINSYAVIDVDKAVNLLQEVLGSEKVIKDAYIRIINYANLAFLFFVQKRFKMVVRTIQNIYRHDFYAQTDIHLQAQLAILELMARLELEDADTFEYRLKQIEKSFATEWKTYEGVDRNLIDIARLMFDSTGYRKNTVIKEMAQSYLTANAGNRNRIFNYDNWIREKMR